MALALTPITGRVPLPDDTAFVSGQLILELSGHDADGDAAMAQSRVMVDLEGTDIPAGFAVWSNFNGVTNTSYRATVAAIVDIGNGITVRREFYLGSFQMGNAASYTLGELLSSPVPDGNSVNLSILSPADARNFMELGDMALRDTVATSDLDNQAVTNGKLAVMTGGTLKGAVTTGNPQDLTPAQARSVLDVETTAQLDDRDTANRARGNHTGTQLAATISDFATAVALAPAVAANTAKVSNATHTGDVTGATALTIAAGVVTNAKLAGMAVNTIKGAATAGAPQDLTPAAARAVMQVSDFATRADLVTWAAANTPAVGHIRTAAGLSYIYLGTGTWITDLPGWHPLGAITPDHFAHNASAGTTDMGPALNAAGEYVFQYLRTGVVWLEPKTYATSQTVWAKQGVTYHGEQHGFANQYVSGQSRPTGACIFALAGLNADVCLARCDLTNDGGVLEDSNTGLRNSEARHWGGFRGITIWGNRSADPTPTVRDRNTAGHGIKVEGSRYVHIVDCAIMFCADDGVNAGSYDYGTGAIVSNNLHIRDSYSHSNFNEGWQISGADYTICGITAGYNGGSGISATQSGTITDFRCWNNGRYGFYFQDAGTRAGCAISGFYIYDNDWDGMVIGTGRAPSISSGVIRGNGRSGSGFSNLLISSGAYDWNVTGIQSLGIDQSGVITTDTGIWINNTTNSGSYSGLTDAGSPVGILIADPSKAIAHGGVNGITHPGFTATGDIDMAGRTLENLLGVSASAWRTVINESSTLACADSLLVAMNAANPVTITDMTTTLAGLPVHIVANVATSIVRFTQNTNKIRLNGRMDMTLNQYESATFVLRASGVWQQIGGKEGGAAYTVAGLPAAGTAGRRAYVTDASASTFHSVVAGGGSNIVPVRDDGFAWRIG